MNFQIIIIALLFIAAVAYVARMLYNNLTVKKGCGTNCKCSVDFSGIEPAKAAK